MGLKILHSADLHLDTPFAGFDSQRRELLRTEQRRVPGLLADLCRQEGCDLVLLAGDIFDGVPTRESLDALKAAVRECGVPVFISPGNHDFVGVGSAWLEEVWPENVYIFTGALQSIAPEGLDCRIWGAGFQSMDCPALLEGFRAEGEELYQLGLFHGDAMTHDSPYNPINAAQIRNSNLCYLALGHIHKADSLRVGDTLCAWPGCPMGRGWDETGEKGVYIVTLDGDAEISWHAIPGIRFRDETVDVEQGAFEALEAALPAGESRDFFRITLTGPGEADPEQLQQRFGRIPNLWLRDQTEPPVDLWAGVGEDTLEGVYFGMLRNAADQAEGREREQILLAAKISRTLLRGREVKLP